MKSKKSKKSRRNKKSKKTKTRIYYRLKIADMFRK